MVNIKRIRIEHFRSLQEIDLRLDGGAFFTGNNGAGKSSIFEAVRFALLGFCQNTDRRGAGAKGLVSDGADEASIAIELEGGPNMTGARVQVDIPRDGAVRWSAENLGTGRVIAKKPSELWSWLGVSGASLTASLLPGEHITTQGFEGVLAEYQAGLVDPGRLRELCGAEYDALLAGYPGAANGEPPRMLLTLSGLRAVGEEAYGARRETGRVVKALEAQIPAEAPKPPTDRNGAPLGTEAAAALKKTIGDLAAARDALMRELGEARQNAKIAVPGDADQLKAAAKEAAKAADVAREIADGAQTAHAKAVDGYEAINQRHGVILREMEATRERVQEITELLDGYEVGKPCHACGVKWTEARVKSATATLRAQRMDFANNLKDAEVLIGNLAADAEKAKERVAKAFAEAEAATNASIEASSEASRLLRDYELALRLDGVRPPEAVEADLLEIDERLDRAKAAMGQLAIVAEYEAKKADLEAARARYAHMDWRVKAFRDGEILNELGADGLKTFEQAVDHALMSFGYGFAFAVDGRTVKVLFGRRGEALRPIERASTGEQKLAEIAVALTFAGETGIALVDDLDHLDGSNRNQALSDISHEMRETHSDKGYIQIIAAGAWSKPTEPDLTPMERALDPLRPIWLSAKTPKHAEAAA